MKTEKCIFLLRILCRVHLWLIQWTLRLGQFFVNLFRNCLQEDSELIVKLRSCFDMLNDENIFFHWPNCSFYLKAKGISGGSVVKNPPDNEEDTGLIPGLGRYPDEGNGNSLQYYCMGNLMDSWAWQATVHGVTKHLDTNRGAQISD